MENPLHVHEAGWPRLKDTVMTFKSALVYGVCLAMGLCLSAWMGLADAKATSNRNTMAAMSAKQAAEPTVAAPGNPSAAPLKARRYRRSLIPLARPLASSTTSTQTRPYTVQPHLPSSTVPVQPLGESIRQEIKKVP